MVEVLNPGKYVRFECVSLRADGPYASMTEDHVDVLGVLW
jgi:hypothetical protein